MLLKAALYDEETLRITRGSWHHFEILNVARTDVGI